MAELSKWDKANLSRLEKCLTPVQNKIKIINNKVKELMQAKAELLKNTEGYQKLIDEIKAKEQVSEVAATIDGTLPSTIMGETKVAEDENPLNL